MPPAIRAHLALPAEAQRAMEQFLELVPGCPLTQAVQDELANKPDGFFCQKPKVWQFVATRRTRAVRKNGEKVSENYYRIGVNAYFAHVVIPVSFTDEFCMRRVWEWEGTATDIAPKLVEAKAIIKRIETGELCGDCHLKLTMTGRRLCDSCAIQEFMKG